MLTNEQLIESLEEKGVLRSKRIKQALEKFPREKFVPADMVMHVYEDRPLPIGEGQTISQPFTVVFMLELLDARAGHNVLEIGAGSGWQTALLSHLVTSHIPRTPSNSPSAASLRGRNMGHVWAYEINEAVGQFGIENLAPFKLKNATYVIADASRRWSEHAPYDRIIAGAAFREIPDALRQLLKVGGPASSAGGRLVAPTQHQDVRVIERTSQNKFEERIYPGFVFVPVVHG